MKMILLVPMMIACSLLGCAADSEGCRPLQRGKTVHFDTDDKHYLYFWHKAVMASTQNNMTVSTMNVQKVIIFNSSIITHFKRTSIIYREKDTVTEISGGGVELTIIKPGMVKNVSVVSNGIMDWVICSSDEDFPSISENKFPITLMLVVALALVVLVVIFVAVAFIYRFKKTLFNESPIGMTERLMSWHIPLTNGRSATLFGICAPTVDGDNLAKDSFYESLSLAPRRTPHNDNTLDGRLSSTLTINLSSNTIGVEQPLLATKLQRISLALPDDVTGTGSLVFTQGRSRDNFKKKGKQVVPSQNFDNENDHQDFYNATKDIHGPVKRNITPVRSLDVQAELNNYKKTIREHSEQEIQLPSANKWQQKVEDAYDEWNINSDVIRQECRNSIYVPADEIMQDAHERLKPCEPI
ncbi:hypothetical protein Hamer_G006351 [Homarus americanus]|uniref:Uncharacterized protein n=1 Tax=Homarus americanus TaxID=6706 RepID=A0A8J5JMR3_HOMAM|nr:hypothetical protein Hamer_G006351 [Homarus americanus]